MSAIRDGGEMRPLTEADLDAQANAWEAAFDKVQADVDALDLPGLAGVLRQAADQISEHARDCFGDDSEMAYRFEAAAVYRAAQLIERLAKEGGAK